MILYEFTPQETNQRCTSQIFLHINITGVDTCQQWITLVVLYGSFLLSFLDLFVINLDQLDC